MLFASTQNFNLTLMQILEQKKKWFCFSSEFKGKGRKLFPWTSFYMHGFLNELDLSSFQQTTLNFATGKLTQRLCKLFSAQNVLSQRISFFVNFQEQVGWGPRLAPYPLCNTVITHYDFSLCQMWARVLRLPRLPGVLLPEHGQVRRGDRGVHLRLLFITIIIIYHYHYFYYYYYYHLLL